MATDMAPLAIRDLMSGENAWSISSHFEWLTNKEASLLNISKHDINLATQSMTPLEN